MLRLAHELKKHLHEVAGWDGPVTNRQYLVWMSWIRNEWNEPNRTDHYLMRVAQVVARKFVKEPSEIKLDHFRIPFGTSEVVEAVAETKPAEKPNWMKGREPPPIMTKELIKETKRAMAKAAWMKRMKGKPDGE